MNDIFWRLLNRLLLPILDEPLKAPSAHEERLCEDLREKCRQYIPVNTLSLLPSDAAWKGYMNSIHENVLKNDPRSFLRWPPVVLMMAPTRVSFFVKDLQYLRHRPDWTTRWRDAVRESPAGHPVPFLLWPRSSGNLIRHAYYLAKFEEHIGTKIDDMEYIFDFGGGYGCMCRLVHNLGFHGRYVIFDLPLFTHLQEFYLRSADVKARFRCISDFDKLTIALSDIARLKRTMFIATESFSEIPIDQRERFLPLISAFKFYLVSYSHTYREVNNVEYFEKWRQNLGPHVQWHVWTNPRKPDYTHLAGKK